VRLVRYSYAIVYRGIVVSRFVRREDALKALSKLPKTTRKHFRILPITSKIVERYYGRVNRRRRVGLKPIPIRGEVVEV
jgi:hypothetical protein